MNPYITNYPIAPIAFAGREEQISFFSKALEQTCNTNPVNPRNIAIIGGWGIGKTSLLNKFIDIANQKNCLIVKITLSPEKCKNMQDFAANTIDAFHRAIWKYEKLSAKLKTQFSKWKIDGLQLLGIHVKKKREKTTTASTILTSKIIEFWELIKHEVPTIIIAYDDLQYLYKQYPDGLYDLRAIFQDTRESEVRTMLLITGDNSLFSSIRGFSEPLLRFFEQIHLVPFLEREALEALTLPLKLNNIKLHFNKNVVAKIFEKTGRHPYFLNFFAHDLFEYKPVGRITIKLFEHVYGEILDHVVATRFINDLAITSDLEREVLSFFSEKDILSNKDVKKITNPSMIFKRLEEKGLIIKIKRGSYKVYHPLFREFLKQSHLS